MAVVVPWLVMYLFGVTASEMDLTRCPRCRENKVSRSKARGLADAVFKTAGLFPFRCNGCRFRYHRRYEKTAGMAKS